MRRYSIAFLIALSGFLAVSYGETPADAVRALVEAERKFCQTGQEKGTRAAFLTFLAPDGIVFRPGPVSGQEVWSKRTETGFDLVWEPTFAAIARSGDFGYDTGPAKWRAQKTDDKFIGFGHFVSIWKKQEDGVWKVALDCGIENPEPAGKIETLRTVVPDTPAKADQTAERSLQAAQKVFTILAKLDFTKAIREYASPEVRVYRNGSFPAVGKDAAAKLLGAEQAGVTMDLMKRDMSSSGDLAYSYGSCSDTRTQPAVPGHFLHVWQTDATGAWKLVLDWQQPLSKP